jgi:hypothetical protein
LGFAALIMASVNIFGGPRHPAHARHVSEEKEMMGRV